MGLISRVSSRTYRSQIGLINPIMAFPKFQFSNDGKFLALQQSKNANLVIFDTCTCASFVCFDENLVSFSWSFDSKFLAVGDESGNVLVLDNNIKCVKFYYDHQSNVNYLATLTQKGEIIIS